MIAPAIAPFLGGIFIVTFGWQFVFLFSGPICLVLSGVALILLKEEKHRSKNPLNWFGFVLSSAILIDIFYVISKLGREGISSFSVFCLIAIIPLISIFIFHELRVKCPLINLSYFKNKTFIKANLLQLCFQVCHFGAIFIIGMYLQISVGFSAMLAGLIMGMQAIGAMTTSRYSVKLFNKYGPNLPIITGLMGIAIISPCIMLINNTHMLLFGLILFFMRGTFSGLSGTPIQTLSVIDFHKKSISTINGIFSAFRQISISFGVALSSMLISIGLKSINQHDTFQMKGIEAFQVFKFGFFAISIIAIIGVAICKSIQEQ